jgi:hypothetical protein
MRKGKLAVTVETFERSLRAFSQRRPFEPFLVELASGARLTVDHPEALAQRGPAAVYISAGGEYTLFDNTMVVNTASQGQPWWCSPTFSTRPTRVSSFAC